MSIKVKDKETIQYIKDKLNFVQKELEALEQFNKSVDLGEMWSCLQDVKEYLGLIK